MKKKQIIKKRRKKLNADWKTEMGKKTERAERVPSTKPDISDSFSDNLTFPN